MTVFSKGTLKARDRCQRDWKRYICQLYKLPFSVLEAKEFAASLVSRVRECTFDHLCISYPLSNRASFFKNKKNDLDRADFDMLSCIQLSPKKRIFCKEKGFGGDIVIPENDHIATGALDWRSLI